MENRVLELQVREKIGSPGSRNFRKQGLIPAIVYSRGEKSVPSILDFKQFVRVAEVSRPSQVFTIKSADKRLDGRLALVKEVQKDYVKDRLLHVGIQALKDNEEINVDIPVRIVGEAPGVKTDGGILAIVRREITVRCLPKLIPNEIKVDVGTLGLGDSIHARNIPLEEGVKLVTRSDETIVSVVTTRAEEEAAPVAAAATAAATPGAEGTAAPAAGAAPAAAAATAAAPAADAKKAPAKK